LASVKVEVFGLKDGIGNLAPKSKLRIAGQVLEQIRKEIQHGTTDYMGSRDFRAEAIKVIVKDKTLKLIVDEDSDKQIGKPMSNPGVQDLVLNLKEKDWYVYEENYGTSEEKYFVKYINSIIDKLKKEFAEIYLLRNARLFQLYRFSDGKAFEPDYVMFLRKKRSKSFVVYQMFIEPKGDHLLKTDEWKEAFLAEIEREYKIQVITATDEYRLVGLPFYNRSTRRVQFEEALSRALEVEL
jgi:type III restriction enzyme